MNHINKLNQPKPKEIPIGKAQDIRNQLFGSILPLYRTNNPGKTSAVTFWCKNINCNHEFYQQVKHLKPSNNCPICNLIKNNLTGKVFNKLTVLRQANENEIKDKKIKQNYWLCECSCDNHTQIIVSTHDLLTNHTQSCGCLQRETAKKVGKINGKKESPTLINEIGNRYGKLLVISRNYDKNSSSAYWNCLCDCGTITVCAGTALRAGAIQSCGCINSLGEEKICKILNDNNIPYIKEKTFDDLRSNSTNALLRFDFYIDNKYLIEYDGEQHYRTDLGGWRTKEYIEKIQIYDNQKKEWCKNNNIPLIRIPYWHLQDLCIEDLQLETSKFII